MRRALLLAIVNVTVFAIAAELAALLVFYYQHGWLFYLDPYRPPIAMLPDTAGQGLTPVGVHPYFGVTHRAGIPFDLPPSLATPDAGPVVATNNFGFASRRDYPVARAGDRQFIVGIFGGSVGGYFCRIGVNRFEQDLRQQPFFRDKELVTLCFSHEGYKQPQQLLVLSYFLSIGQPFDLVVNIDGFNEVALGRINDQYGWDVSMPSHEHLDPLINLVNQSTLTPAKLDALYRITHDKQRLNAIAARGNATRSAAVAFVLERYHAYLLRRYQAEQVEFDRLPSNPPANSAIHVTPKVRARSGDALYEDIAANWRAASDAMRQLLAARHVPYVHVLQPNQYYSTRTFSDAEKKAAFNDASPFKAGAQAGYPFLEKALEAGAVNAVRLFDAEREPMYVDDCCHYTVAGNYVLADAIARAVLASTAGAPHNK